MKNHIVVKGKCNEALVYTDILEPSAHAQILTLCNQEFVRGARIRMMPDVHAGAGCVIGTTMTVTDRVVPNLVGVDIGCGMEAVRIAEHDTDCALLDRLVRELVPAGFDVRKKPHRLVPRDLLRDLRCADHVDIERGRRSVGTLGGGNHFIELDRAEDGTLWLVVHSGSRNVGLQVAGHYQRAAEVARMGLDMTEVRKAVAETAPKKLKQRLNAMLRERAAQGGRTESDVPKDLAWLAGALMEDYLHDMKVMTAYASLNRRAIAEEIVQGMGWTVEDRFETVHNTIDTDAKILRKGSVSARSGERFLLPMNMRDGSLVCVGKGNPEWNFSAPHGAGRIMSRNEAKHALSMTDFEASMDGIFTTSVSRDTLDEAPMAYKPMESILSFIGDTANVTMRLRPIYNFKAAEPQTRR